MIRTPDEIKKGPECCARGDCHSCPYVHNCNLSTADALALIQQLQDEKVELLKNVEQLQAERDAAVETIYEMAKCITDDVCEWCDQTECERLCMMHATERPGFKWRGIQKEGEG